MSKKTIFLMALLATIVQGALAWDGSGTASDPYLVRNSSDWQELADSVAAGKHVSCAFRLTGDITAASCVGTPSHPFMGSFDGGGHAITANLVASSGVMGLVSIPDR